ncbi:beta-galactosidase [Actinoplanes friuliensis]|uniref:Beta-galactosidase n=1 Tax=Actinoplanes friuliensis DSM 7358 TaxID=1246995 RepID=U5W266_9ACTN|nr:beta-galactosidase [Actinoplanes friuliensis]AGZ42050.1 putative beta-galactosidase [Actinoplanes friuliensis DSM 7358]
METSHRWLRPTDPRAGRRLEFGADYNPEQWPRSVWDDDIRAMRVAGVTVVSLAIFSWARLEPSEGEYTFGWLDEVMDLLHAGGIAVDLATATASPPPWLTTKYPEILPVDRQGATVWPGGRQHWRPTSPIFREHALRLVRTMAGRYGGHPALTAWHISNELGCHNAYDYSDDAAAAFRTWLQNRYTGLDALNAAWGTAFWSQHYSEWAQILPPRQAATHPNPTQQLDFKRFSSDALKDYLRAERAVLRELTPEVPATTNFMVMDSTKALDYADWAAEVDFVANDHYVQRGPRPLDELSFSANLTGHLAGGRPWFLMEHSTSAVNWQPINVPKAPGALARDSLTHVAHGADAVCFFQWRQSVAGAEKYHSAMLPQAGEDSAVFRSVVQLGETLRRLAPLSGTPRSPARAAILFDWTSWWVAEQDSHPTDRLRYRQEALDWYSAFLDLGVRADVVPVATDLSGYDLVVAPVLHVVPAALAERLTAFVAGGGHLVTTYFSGIVDENDHLWAGGHPGAFRDLLGLRIEEFGPLPDDEPAELDNGSAGTLWADHPTVTGTDVTVLAAYRDGSPAVTRRTAGTGSAAYVGTRLGPDGLAPVLGELLSLAGVGSELPPELRGRVELAIRGDFRFLINRTAGPVELTGLAGEALHGSATLLEARGVTVLRVDPQ